MVAVVWKMTGQKPAWITFAIRRRGAVLSGISGGLRAAHRRRGERSRVNVQILHEGGNKLLAPVRAKFSCREFFDVRVFSDDLAMSRPQLTI